jgi:hypothetical protein
MPPRTQRNQQLKELSRMEAMSPQPSLRLEPRNIKTTEKRKWATTAIASMYYKVATTGNFFQIISLGTMKTGVPMVRTWL